MKRDSKEIEIYQALSLPIGTIKQIVPKLVRNGKVYAYELRFQFPTNEQIAVDARQVNWDIPSLESQYGEMGLYITQFAKVSSSPSPNTDLEGYYLGQQTSMVFFQDLLNRYYMLFHQQDVSQSEDDGITEFQDYYDQVMAQYHPRGFPLPAYHQLPMLSTRLGTFFLAVEAYEQLQAMAHPGDHVFVAVKNFSFASFKPLKASFLHDLRPMMGKE